MLVETAVTLAVPALTAVAKPVLESIVRTSVLLEDHLITLFEAFSGAITLVNFIEVPSFNLFLGAEIAMLVTGTASTSS